MRSTMMDAPLLVSRILEHGATVHGRSEVVTWTGAEPRTMTYAEVGRTAARLAHALRDAPDATFVPIVDNALSFIVNPAATPAPARREYEHTHTRAQTRYSSLSHTRQAGRAPIHEYKYIPLSLAPAG